MSMPILRKWLRLPSRIALLLGVGALSGTGAIPAMAEPGLHNGPVRAPQQSAKSFGEVRIWSEDGRIYFSEGGNEPRELQLSDTPEARRLRQLLEHEGAVAESPRVLQHRMILVGGGGEAIHWGGAPPSKGRDNAGKPEANNGSDNGARAGKAQASGQVSSAEVPNVVGADRRK
jgi:hypothetical protein